jgi:arsenate reductase-like glutaredoxin family protein
MKSVRKTLYSRSQKAMHLLEKNNIAIFVSKTQIRQRTVSGLQNVIRVPRMLLWAFLLEGVETKKMLHTFVKKGKSHVLVSTASETPTEEELREAIDQLKDLPKFLPFFVFITVPVPGVTESYVLLAFTLEKWLGRRFSLLPSQFRKVFQK